MRLGFHGAAGTVTGSKTTVEGGGTRILVDCGMFQGFKNLRERNWEPLRIPHIKAVVLTHAHLDHSGWLPALIKGGWTGDIYCTQASADLLAILLPDAGRISEEDAKRANKHGYSKHEPAEALYTEEDAHKTLKFLRVVPRDEPFKIGALELELFPAGHILGASMVRISDGETSVLMSGDLGRSDDMITYPPRQVKQADYVVMESTYGDRLHSHVDTLGSLAEIINRTAKRGGAVLIPAFAVGRAQALLWAMHVLRERGDIPQMPVAIDSPMSVDTTELYLKHHDEVRLTHEEVARMCGGARLCRSVRESKALNGIHGPHVIISASGMLTGGRVLHHLARMAIEPKNTVIFVGYQAPGTRGGRLLRGETEIRLHGREIPIECDVERIDGFSAHADQQELMDWLKGFEEPPIRVFLNHGDQDSSDVLRKRIQTELKYDCKLARDGVGVALVPPGSVPGSDLPLVLGKDRGVEPVVAEAIGAGITGVIALPSGLGTLSALLEVLDLIQSGQLPKVPVVLVGKRFWDKALPTEWLLESGMLTRTAISLIDFAEDEQEARDKISLGL